eukprot:scaffold8611_cov108-Isochrysis_galbana.AAC.9
MHITHPPILFWLLPIQGTLPIPDAHAPYSTPHIGPQVGLGNEMWRFGTCGRVGPCDARVRICALYIVRIIAAMEQQAPVDRCARHSHAAERSYI